MPNRVIEGARGLGLAQHHGREPSEEMRHADDPMSLEPQFHVIRRSRRFGQLERQVETLAMIGLDDVEEGTAVEGAKA